MSLSFSDETSLQTNDSQQLATPPSSEPAFQVDSQGNFIHNFVPDGAEPFSPNIDLYSLIDWSSYKDEKCPDPLSLDSSGNDNALWLIDSTFSLNVNNNVGANYNNGSIGPTPMSDDTIATTPLTSSMANINISDLPTLQPPSNNFQAPANSVNIFSNTLCQHTINNSISNTNGITQFSSFPSLSSQQQPTNTTSPTTTMYPEIPYDMAFMGCVPHFSQVSIPSPVNSTNSTTDPTTITTTTTTTTSQSRSRTAKGKRRLPTLEVNPASNASTNSTNNTTEESRPRRKPKPTPPPKSSPCSEDNTADTLVENDPTKIEDMKRNRRLQKNRQAAQQFRARQKAHIIETEEKVDQLRIDNGESAALLEILEAENRLLKEQLNYLHNFISSAVSIQNITGTSVSIASFSMDQITPTNHNNDSNNINHNHNHNNINSPSTNIDRKESEAVKMNSDSYVTPVTLSTTSPPIPTSLGNIKTEQ